MKKRIVNIVLTICIMCTFMPQIYAENASVALSSTNDITTEELFMKYPTYLSNANMDDGFKNGQEACYAILDSYSDTDTAVAVAMTALSKGISVKVRDELASFGLTDSTYETYAKDAAKEMLEQALGDEHTIGKSAKKVSKAYKHFKTAYKDINTLGQAEVLEELRTIASENDISMTTEEVDAIVKELFKSKDLKKGLDNLDTAMDMWKYVTEMTELFAIEASTIDFLMDELDKSGQSEGDLYLGLSLLRRDIHQNPATYVLKRYVTEKAISFLSKNMEKLIYGVTGASTITVAAVQAFAKLFADYVYVDAKADKLTQAIMHMSYISSIETCLSQYRLKFLQGTATADDIDTYEALYGACNNAYVSALDSCYSCAKLNDKFSLGGDCKIWADEIENYYTYDKYLEWCKAEVKHDLENTLVDSETGTSTITDALNEETILKNLERVYRLYPPNKGEIWNGKYDGVRGSVGFAAKVFNHVFDSSMRTTVDNKYKYILKSNANVRLIGRLDEDAVTADAIKKMFKEARVGDVVFTSGKDDDCHAMILVGATDNGIKVYDCDSKFYNNDALPYTLKEYEFTYSAMATSFSDHGKYKDVAGISIYRAIKKVSDANTGKSLDDEEYDDSVNYVIENGVLKEYTGNRTEIHIPYGVTEIGDNCFEGNQNITKVYLPDTVTAIGNEAFYRCDELAYIKMSSNLKSIGYETFCYTIIPSVFLPEGIQTIGEDAFAVCYKLKSINLPESLISIGERAFDGCAIVSVDIPKSIKTISASTFIRCQSLENVNISEGITEIGPSAFSYCVSLESIKIPDGVTTIGYGSFELCEALEKVELPESITDFSKYMFSRCWNLSQINIPHKVKSIPQSAFYATGFKHFTIPGHIESIGKDAFSFSDLETVTIEEGVKIIGENAFEQTHIKEVNIPDSVVTLEPGAFNCTLLENVYIGSGVEEIDNDSTFAWNYDMKNYYVSKNNKYFSSIDGVLFNKDRTKLLEYPIGRQNRVYAIPSGVAEIGSSAFYLAKSLENIVVPESVTCIGAGAFAFCENLESLKIPDNAESLGRGALSTCKSLKTVTIPRGITEIFEDTFYSCYSLTDVYYGGTEEEWSRVSIGRFNGGLSNATIIFQSKPPTAKIENFAVKTDDEVCRVSIEASNLPKAADVLFASYDKDGKLLEIKSVQATNGIAQAELKNEYLDKIKSFVWFETLLMPLTDYQEALIEKTPDDNNQSEVSVPAPSQGTEPAGVNNISFMNMKSYLDTLWGDDEYVLSFSFQADFDVVGVGVKCVDAETGEEIEYMDKAYKECDVKMGDYGNYYGCHGGFANTEDTGQSPIFGSYKLGHTYQWFGYVKDINGNTYSSDIQTFVFTTDGSRFI